MLTTIKPFVSFRSIEGDGDLVTVTSNTRFAQPLYGACEFGNISTSYLYVEEDKISRGAPPLSSDTLYCDNRFTKSLQMNVKMPGHSFIMCR